MGMKHHKHRDCKDEESVPTCTSDAVRVSNIAATMPAGLPAAQSVKMAGYLDKRGKRLPTWKRYWFVLDGRLLLYFGSQFDYLNQLSPCRGSLNLGIVSGVRPAGSARASSPQLEIATRSQAVLLRAKDRVTQERWLKALLDAMQMHGNPMGSASGTHFRYTSASLPQPSSTKTRSEETLVEATEEDDDGEDEATSRVLQRIKTIGNPSHGTLVGEILNTGRGTLKHVQTDSRKKVHHTSSRAGEIAAQIPTSAAVHRLLERRQQEHNEEEHVTTIQIEPADSENTVAIVKDDVEVQVENEEYAAAAAATPAPTPVVPVEGEYEGMYEDMPVQNKDDDYATVEEMATFEPSLPPRREDSHGKDEDTKLLTPQTSCNIKRKRSFLQRMLGTNKNKKQKPHYNKKNIPTIKVEEVEIDDTDAYETVDYEELIKNLKYKEDMAVDEPKAGKEKELPQEVELPLKEDKTGQPKVELLKKIETQINSSEYVNVNTILKLKSTENSTENTSSSAIAKENNSCIIPIVENEKTHTVTITVQNTSSYTPTESEQPAIPKLPPRRTSSSSSLGATSIARPVSPWHDVPTNNESVLAKSKRTSSGELIEEQCDLHKTIINIAGNDQVQTEIQEEKIENILSTNSEKSEPVHHEEQDNSCMIRSLLAADDSQLLEQICDTRCTLKHQSADELDLLLCQLTKITNSPIHRVSVSALEPLRKRRLGSDPDYDIPRPHNIYTTLEKQKRENDNETMEATRFLNDPDLYYARPLSEYLKELDRMSHIQEVRSTRANTALKKWLEEAPKLIPTTLEDDEEVAMLTAINENSLEVEQVKPAASVVHSANADDNSNQDSTETNGKQEIVEETDGAVLKQKDTGEEVPEPSMSKDVLENSDPQVTTAVENMPTEETNKSEIDEENTEDPVVEKETIVESKADITCGQIPVEQVINEADVINNEKEELNEKVNVEMQEEKFTTQLPDSEAQCAQEVTEQLDDENNPIIETISSEENSDDNITQNDEPAKEISEIQDENETCTTQIQIDTLSGSDLNSTTQDKQSGDESVEDNSKSDHAAVEKSTEQTENPTQDQESTLHFANDNCILEQPTENVINEVEISTNETEKTSDAEKNIDEKNNVSKNIKITLNEENTDKQEHEIKNENKEVPSTAPDIKPEENKEAETELDKEQKCCSEEKAEDIKPELLNDSPIKTEEILESLETESVLINDSTLDQLDCNLVQAEQCIQSEETINEGTNLSSNEIPKLEITQDPQTTQEQTFKIVRRENKSDENIAHRLSFAKSDSELVFQEAVHHLKTPFTSTTFEFAPQQD